MWSLDRACQLKRPERLNTNEKFQVQVSMKLIYTLNSKIKNINVGGQFTQRQTKQSMY